MSKSSIAETFKSLGQVVPPSVQGSLKDGVYILDIGHTNNVTMIVRGGHCEAWLPNRCAQLDVVPSKWDAAYRVCDVPKTYFTNPSVWARDWLTSQRVTQIRSLLIKEQCSLLGGGNGSGPVQICDTPREGAYLTLIDDRVAVAWVFRDKSWTHVETGRYVTHERDQPRRLVWPLSLSIVLNVDDVLPVSGGGNGRYGIKWLTRVPGVYRALSAYYQAGLQHYSGAFIQLDSVVTWIRTGNYVYSGLPMRQVEGDQLRWAWGLFDGRVVGRDDEITRAEVIRALADRLHASKLADVPQSHEGDVLWYGYGYGYDEIQSAAYRELPTSAVGRQASECMHLSNGAYLVKGDTNGQRRTADCRVWDTATRPYVVGSIRAEHERGAWLTSVGVALQSLGLAAAIAPGMPVVVPLDIADDMA